jgi:hypothetical protein
MSIGDNSLHSVVWISLLQQMRVNLLMFYVRIGPCSHMVFIPAEMCLDLKDGANKKVGDLTILLASSLSPTRYAVENVNQAAEQLGPGLAVVNSLVQAAVPLAAQITTEFNVWQLLLNCVRALVKVVDIVAKVL